MKKYKSWLMRLIPVAFLLVYIIGLSEIFYQSQVKSSEEHCMKELTMNRDDISREVSTLFNNSITMLDLASDAIMMKAGVNDEAAMLEYIGGVCRETLFDRIDVVLPPDNTYPEGSIFIPSTRERISDKGDLEFEELVSIVGIDIHISPRVDDYLYPDKQAIHIFSSVVDSENETIAFLCATVHCESMEQLFGSSHYGDDAQLFIVDRRDGNIIFDKRNDNHGNIDDMKSYDVPTNEGQSTLLTDIKNGETGSTSYESKQGKEATYMLYAPIEETELSIIMIIRESVAMADLKDQQTALAWAGFFELILLVVLIVWVYFMTRRSMETEDRATAAELELLHKKEHELEEQYKAAADRRDFLETMSTNLPGGYHRCSTDDGFYLSFMSNSFLDITGYTAEQIEQEFGSRYINLVAPEDRDYFMSLEPELKENGEINCVYRIKRRDGSLCWVKDSTQKIERDGESYYQCTLADINDFVSNLNEAKRMAEESSNAKTTFLFNASHDIRTPMNAILGFARMIKENSENSEIVDETVDKVIKAGTTLMTLLNDVLELSRIEQGKDDLNLEAICLTDHGVNLYEMFAQDMETAGINFKKNENVTHKYVFCDALKLDRIIMNFLSNAKKFTPKGGSVTFGVEELSSDDTSATYRFFTNDTGIGMSREFQARAFGQFERERTATESGVSGSGLGLSITKRIVDLMGGKIEIQSELGKGTEISAVITLKLADENTVEGKTQSKDFIDMTEKRVLLVEDNEFNREIAKYILDGMNFIVDEAENGAVCVDMITRENAHRYDLVLMDIQMPIMDGYKATEEIRSIDDNSLSSVPIIAMTANAFEEDKQKCLDVGMNGHIGKPIDPENLLEEIKKIFTK